MKTSQEQIMKALSGMIPEDAQKDVSAAVSSFLENAIKELEEEYNTKLEEAYKQVSAEKAKDEQIAEEGYTQAWSMISDLRDRLEIQKEEFDKALEEGYEEAYKMLQEQRAKNDSLEVSLYEEYDKRLADIKEFMVDKLDQFLQLQGEKYYEMAKKDVMNDPTFAEHALAFDRILEVAANYISDEDFAFATRSKMEAIQKNLDKAKAEMRILEAKNMRLATDNDKLNESLKQQQDILTENVKRVEKKERLEKSRRAEGRGELEPQKRRQVVIAEQVDEPAAAVQEQEEESRDDSLLEHIGEEIFKDWNFLSGETAK